MKFVKKFRVEPGSHVDLGSIDPGFHGDYANDAEAAQELQRNLTRITELQRKLYADRTHSLLIVLQGIDSAGKDGTCWHVISAMDPQGVQVTGFKQPTPEEQDARLSVARPSACAAARLRFDLQSLALRRRARRARA